MTTVDRKHPTYRDLLAALQSFNDQDLDMPIKICDNEKRQTHAVLEYYHDFYSDSGPHIAIKPVDEIIDDDLIRYTVVEDFEEDTAYSLCNEEDSA